MIGVVFIPGGEVGPYSTRFENSLKVFKTFPSPSDAFPWTTYAPSHQNEAQDMI